ncbi:MAG TPA: hypothetical protein ENH60_03150, partial [Pricia sp.]|nr:hypothetical protein [Pricia sp.]
FACIIFNDPKNGYLRKGTKESLLKSVISVAQTGLTLNPIAKEAFLIPRYNNVSKSIQIGLEPSYVGLVKLLTDTGSVTSINTQLVYAEDEFQINLAADDPVRHIPALKNRENLIGVYSIAKLATGEKQVEWMEISEVHKIRDTSESYKSWKKDSGKSTIWNTYYGEMVRKTVLKRIYKYLPRTDRMQYADKAVQLSNADWEPSSGQVMFADALIKSSTLPEFKKDELEKELQTANSSNLELMIAYLEESQPEKIESGGNYNQGDIGKKLDLIDNDPNK